MTVDPPPAPQEPNGLYLDRLMRRSSFQALWPLFSKADKPAKELTESFSALVHLRPLLKEFGRCRVIHVGDGAHGRTAALFALKSDTENISVDPLVNERLLAGWQLEFGIRDFAWHKARIEDQAEALNCLEALPTLVTFVHAHVHTDQVLQLLKWDAAFVLSCCVPGNQLSTAHVPIASGEDMSVLSADRNYQVLRAATRVRSEV